MSDVLVRVEGRAGRITLNRPQALNALTLPMVRAIDAALIEWADDPSVSLVVVDGAGERGLCAGGDIRSLYDAAKAGDFAGARDFFAAEYAMNARIAAFPKPYVAIMDGVVMGGGVGVSAHGSVRVVTERTSLAMPETGIGLFPDVGATWLLSRALPLGLHLALTGARIGAADAMSAGLADAFVPSGDLSALIEALRRGDAAVVTKFARTPPATALADGADWIASCYVFDTVESIVDALAAHSSAAARMAANDIATKSPSSLKVTLRALRETADMRGLLQALAQELVLAVNCLRSHDFVEGVRAAVIDKDRRPRWSPSRLQDVTPDHVREYFRRDEAVLF